MGYLKQHCFTVDNVKEFFLSPYTYIVNTEQALYIGREDDRREFCINDWTKHQFYYNTGVVDETTLGEAYLKKMDANCLNEVLLSLVLSGKIARI